MEHLCRGKVECTLAAFVLNGEKLYVDPIFIAQNLNFFWPLIANHGSICAPFEFLFYALTRMQSLEL